MSSSIYRPLTGFTIATRTLSLTLLSGVLFSYGALAADPSPTAAPVSSSTAAAIHHHRFKGTITEVTPTSVTIVKKKSHESHTFQLSPETTVAISGHGALSDLAVGQQIQLQSSTDGQKALHVFIHKSHSSCTAAGESKGSCQDKCYAKEKVSVVPASASTKEQKP